MSNANNRHRPPIIRCGGVNGRCVVFGYVDSEPVKGEPVELFDACNILYWAGKRGLFGLMANGPEPGSRITDSVIRTTETVWQEWTEVSPKAAKSIGAWKRE